MLNKNYFTILKDPASWKTGVNKIIHDMDNRLKSLENSSSSDEGSSEHTHDEYATKEELNSTNSTVDKINSNYVSNSYLEDTLTGFASVNHTHENYLTYNDTISNAEKVGNKSYNQLKSEFALTNHEHTGMCYVKPFIVGSGGGSETVVYLPIYTDEKSMFVLDLDGDGFSITTEFEDDNTVVTIDGGTSSNMYYLFYWTPQQ